MGEARKGGRREAVLTNIPMSGSKKGGQMQMYASVQ